MFLTYIKRLFSLDSRALAIGRILLWSILIRDIVVQIVFLEAFHTDVWVMPLSTLLADYPDENVWSIFSISNNYRYQLTLMIIYLCACIMFTIGRRSHESAVIVWIFTIAMHAHNPLILNGWDTVIRLMLFRNMFLPIGWSWSVDSIRKRTPDTEMWWDREKAPLLGGEGLGWGWHIQIFSIATVWYIIQLCIIYIISAELKNHPIWASEFSATYYALSLDMFRTTIWWRLYQYPWAMKFLTAYSFQLEALGVWFLLIPWKQHRWRFLVVILFIAFHLWLWLTMRLYNFPRIMFAYWIALVPSEVWEWVANALVNSHSPSVPLFEGEASSQEINADQSSLAKSPSQRALASENSVDPAWKGLGESSIATTIHIHRFPFITSLFLIIAIGYCFMRNLRTTDFDRRDDYFPYEINKFWFLARRDQYRNMFAPFPFTDDGWSVIEWKTRSGTKANLIRHDSPVSYTKPSPDQFKNLYPHERWRKLYTTMRMKDKSHYRQYVANYLCYAWNQSHPDDPVTYVTWTYMLERTLADYELEPLTEVVLYEAECT